VLKAWRPATNSIAPLSSIYSPIIMISRKSAVVLISLATTVAWAQNLTSSQKNAVRSAKQYLSTQAFSRNGLVQQLSSAYGDGYDINDASAAVDSLRIDWDFQAVRSAKQYLNMQGYSCKGLIQQLSSDFGEKYTLSQASYGAKQAGACD
jgi:hypothetical protein